ncbi:hypothetical protein GCM10009673_05210 [Nesterenkonia sandarakina]
MGIRVGTRVGARVGRLRERAGGQRGGFPCVRRQLRSLGRIRLESSIEPSPTQLFSPQGWWGAGDGGEPGIVPERGAAGEPECLGEGAPERGTAGAPSGSG